MRSSSETSGRAIPVRSCLRGLPPLLLLCLLSACGGGGRHQAPALSSGSPDYHAPGPPSDPWGPYIAQASRRFDVPSNWIRAVIRQESGGREYLHGQPITSDAGAAGLMQLMPPTYAELADRLGLGPDPYEPHDNIMAGTGYIKDLYDRYGSPAFLAAYDAGPHRLDVYLAGNGSLPHETVDYLASVAPSIAADRPLTGPLAAYGDAGEARPPPVPRAYAAAPASRCWQDPDAAYDPDAPCRSAPVRVAVAAPRRWGSGAAPAPAHFPPSFLLASAEAAPSPLRPAGRWGIQVGAFANPDLARRTAESVRSLAPRELGGAEAALGTTAPFGGRVLYRARLVGLSGQGAAAACSSLTAQGQPCVTVPPGA